MSEYVRELVETHKIPMDKLATDIGATFDEIQLLMKSDMFEAKDVENWAYSEAWFPAESGRTRIPTLWDFVDGKEVIENNKKQNEDSLKWFSEIESQQKNEIGLVETVEKPKKKKKKKSDEESA
jgi:hypothetical protein